MSRHDGKRLHQAVKKSNIKVTEFFSLIGVSRGTLYNYFESENLPDEVKEKVALVLRSTVQNIFGSDNITDSKANDIYRHSIPYVSIALSPAYAHHCGDDTFADQLERVYIPGIPYTADEYRFFEVEGDSMLPGLPERSQVLALRMDKNNWTDIYNYYTHIIVTGTEILVKRLFRQDTQSFILISDNEGRYPQVGIQADRIKELWLVKRKLDWWIPSPVPVEIKIL